MYFLPTLRLVYSYVSTDRHLILQLNEPVLVLSMFAINILQVLQVSILHS
jgi:hypothetical protein